MFLSTDETLSDDVATCEDLQGVQAKYKSCNIGVCPIDAKWSSWPSDWSSCSGNCKKRGGLVPQKSRSRTCIPEKYGGKNCSSLEHQARKNQQPMYTEKQACSELPNCPEPPKMGSWGEWSSCAQTCYHTGQPMPQRERRRSCKAAVLSSDETLNTDVPTCSQLGGIKRYKNCNITSCPGMKHQYKCYVH